MSTPIVPVPLHFDDAVAGRLALALDDLVAELTRFARAAELNARIAGDDWAGYSRTWFDARVEDLLRESRTVAGVAAEELAAVERARAWAAAERQRRLDEAIAAAAAEQAAAEQAAAEAAAAEAAEAARLAEIAAP